ncbi:GTP pyrophosphokinase [Fusibacter sp. JL298sf-3]
MHAIQDKTYDLLDSFKANTLPEGFFDAMKAFFKIQNVYQSAIREVTTKLENLNDEFKFVKDRNPIHQINSRIKAPKSILEKLMRKGHDIDIEAARTNLDDIAGVRVICSYIDDIYRIADLLLAQDDIKLVRKADYIAHPKPNGYRSLHLIIAIPVFLSDRKELVKVEVQIRTIAMDFWASLEHELAYKMSSESVEEIRGELKDCADVIAATDQRMQSLHNLL